MTMKYFDISTIKSSIESLQEISANWLIPGFVFAANNVGTEELVDLSRRLGTDHFLDRYFNGALLGIPPFKATGNNLLRPRLKGIQWNRGDFAGDYMLRQDTKMWGNLFSSRGYREMRLKGYLEGEKTTIRLTEQFQPAFEVEIPSSFQFEDFLVWLFAFTGFPNDIDSWQKLYDYLLDEELKIPAFQTPYLGRFKLTPSREWPKTITNRPSDKTYLAEFAPRLLPYLATPQSQETRSSLAQQSAMLLPEDDAILSLVKSAIKTEQSFSFLFAGPPGTGKTKYAHDIAKALIGNDEKRVLFLQFHPAFNYEDFVEGYRPTEHENTKGVTYTLESRHFLHFADKARNDPGKLYVLVIDELNRGDVARIFGEILTYLEVDYREKNFTLAISGNTISIPKNLIVLATANPFDRSVTDLDDALLRRFYVIMLEPDKVFLKAYLENNKVDARVINRTLRLFELLNGAFPTGFGHTSFLNVKTLEELAEVWTGRVQLSLRRALFHDYQQYQSIQEDVISLLKIDEEAEEIENEQVSSSNL